MGRGSTLSPAEDDIQETVAYLRHKSTLGGANPTCFPISLDKTGALWSPVREGALRCGGRMKFVWTVGCHQPLGVPGSTGWSRDA